nr:MAG: structural polyprotein [Dicistroviridae sp.]
MQHTDNMIHSVVSFLKRPQLVSSFQWSASASRSQNILSMQGSASKPCKVPYSMMTEMLLNKLDGFTSFRATCVLQLQINVQPFQCGRLILVAVPMPDLLLDRAKFILSNVTLAMTVNHVQMDINKQTAVKLRVPFLSPFNSFDLINVQYNWAQIAILVYSPLNQVEQVPLNCELWAHFEDIELGAPTSGKCPIPAQQQGGNVPAVSGGGKFRAPPKEASPTAIASQRASESDGVFATGVRSFAGRLSAAATGAISGVAGAVASIGNFLGWSKPQLSHCGETVVIRPTEYFGNVDAIDHSQVLSLNVMNNIESFTDLCGTDLDECSFDFIKRIPQYVATFKYANSTKYNDKLFQSFVTPTYSVPGTYYLRPRDSQATATTLNSTVAWTQPDSLSYAISPFAYWTGSLVYTLRFVKTDYHSGRIEISYHPFCNTVEPGRFEYIYRIVVDLRENSEVSFTIPFISPQPWKSINVAFDPLITGSPPDTYLRNFTGILYIRAITALQMASSVVPSSIECLVEVRGGDDFQVACPVSSPFIPWTFSNETPVPQQQAGKVYAVPGTQDTRTRALEGFVPPSITGNDRDIERPDTEMLTQGEIFSNYRSLTRRFAFVEGLAQAGGNILLIDPVKYIRPPYLTYTLVKGDVKSINAQGATVTTTYTGYQLNLERLPNPLSFVGSMFCYYRGGVRVKTTIGAQSPPNLMSCRLVWYPRPQDSNGALPQNLKPSFAQFMCPVQYENPNQKRFGEFQIPYYSPTLVSIHWNNNRSILFDQPLPWIEISTNAGTSPTDAQVVRLASAASDDLDFQLYIGPPPCILSKTWSQNQDQNTVLNLYQSVNGNAADPTYTLPDQGPPTGWKQLSKGDIDMSDIVVVGSS